MARIEIELAGLLCEKGLSLGTVESATGGMISNLITNVPGSSAYYLGSVISYSNDVKKRIVGVSERTLEKYGAVSAQVAREMARHGRKLLDVDICVADTGIAGPWGATFGKPVGCFYLGLSHSGGTYARRHVFTGTRLQNKRAAAEVALEWVKEYLTSLK